VEVYQNCVTFNDGAFDLLTGRETRDESRLLLEQGKPLLFGTDRARGIRFRGAEPEVVAVGERGVTESDCAVHDAHAATSGTAFLISQLEPPGFPVPLGVFRAVEIPTYDELNEELGRRARERSGPGRLEELLVSGTTWTIG
jgi:2-oxoglutarate ferredoxin oxidoreductase subunit beta